MNLKFIGTISNSKGTGGKFQLLSVPEGLSLIKIDTVVYIGYSENFTKKYVIKSWENVGSDIIIGLYEIRSKEETAGLKEQAIFVGEEDYIIEENAESYYINELIGCSVYDIDTGDKLGAIKDVWVLPANDVWVVETPKGDLTVPFTEEVVRTCDIKKKRIEIKVIDGLLDLLINGTEEK